MRRAGVSVAVLATLAGLTACGGADDGPAAAAPRETVTTAVSTAADPSNVATRGTAPAVTPTEKPETPPAPFPKGYPNKVAVSSLPDQVRSWYQMSGEAKFAVAIAPGVWAELPPGATVADAVAAEIYDGFCASIKAYERKYTPGQQHAGTCW